MAMTQVPTESGWADDADFLDNVRHVISTFMSLRRVDMDDLAEQAGMARSTLYNRFSGRSPSFSAAELWHLAEALDFSPALFFEPAEGLLRSRCFTSLALVAGAAGPSGDQRTLDEHLVEVEADRRRRRIREATALISGHDRPR